MITPADYVREAYGRGVLTAEDIAAFVAFYQMAHGLEADGKPGPITLASVRPKPAPVPAPVGKFLRSPLPYLHGGRIGEVRKPQITSSFRPTDRKDHDGIDLFYRWQEGDQPNFTGDGGCEGKNADGTPKWVVPYGTDAHAAADGVVQLAGPSPTGYRVWVNHGNGLRSGYFHLEKCYVKAGDTVKYGTALGLVGHNPSPAVDGRHLHFEVSPVEKYEPLDPTKYLSI